MHSITQSNAEKPHTPAPHKLDQQIADFLLSLIPAGRPRRLARMSCPGELKRDGTPRGKYEDISGELTRAMLINHAAGKVTYSYTIDKDAKAKIGVSDLDQGGRAALLALLKAALELGVTAFAIENTGKGKHQGGHLICLFDAFHAAADIKALLVSIHERAGIPATELWPGSNQGIRGLFGSHQLDKTRGDLLLQTGEIVNLDSDLATGFDLVFNLPRNSKPPQAPQEAKPVVKPQAPQKATSAATAHETPRRASYILPNGRVDTKAIGDDVRARFHENHPHYISESLVRAKDGNHFCECGSHSSDQAKIAISFHGGIERGRSWSPDCTWFPSGDKNKYLDPFALYTIREHGGNYRAAVECKAREYGIWIDRTPRAKPTPEEPIELSAAEIARRQAYNDARRTQRHAETLEALDTIYDQVCMLDLTAAVPSGANAESHSARAHLLFTYLHMLACDAGVLQIAPTNERLAADLGFGNRNVSYAFRELEAAGIGKRSGGKSGIGDRPNEAATWTFFRAPNLVCKPHQDAECNLIVLELISNTESNELVSGREQPQSTIQPCLAHQDAPQIETSAEITLPTGKMSPAIGTQLVNWRKPGFDDSDQPEIAVYDPSNAGVIEQQQAEQQPMIIELAPREQAPPLSDDPNYKAFITAWYASKPGAKCKRTGKPYSAKQRAMFETQYKRFLVDVLPEEAALRWHELERPKRRSERRGIVIAGPHKLTGNRPDQSLIFGKESESANEINSNCGSLASSNERNAAQKSISERA